MQGTMLKNQRKAINGNDFSVRKSLLEPSKCHSILVGLVVSGDKDGTIDDEEIGMRGRQSFALFVIAGIRQGKRVEGVGLSVEGAKGKQFLFHRLQFFVVLVGWIITFHIGNGSGRTETGNGVNMPICVVSCQPRLMNPNDSFCLKALL